MAIEYYLKLHSLSTGSCQRLFQNGNSLEELELKILMLNNNSPVPTMRINGYFFKALGISKR